MDENVTSKRNPSWEILFMTANGDTDTRMVEQSLVSELKLKPGCYDEYTGDSTSKASR